MPDKIEISESNYSKSKIEQFLLERGFEHGPGADGEGLMRFVQPIYPYSSWFIYFEDHLLLYKLKGKDEIINPERFDFKRGDFDDFLSVYRTSVDLIKNYFTLNKNIIIGGRC